MSPGLLEEPSEQGKMENLEINPENLRHYSPGTDSKVEFLRSTKSPGGN